MLASAFFAQHTIVRMRDAMRCHNTYGHIQREQHCRVESTKDVSATRTNLCPFDFDCHVDGRQFRACARCVCVCELYVWRNWIRKSSRRKERWIEAIHHRENVNRRIRTFSQSLSLSLFFYTRTAHTLIHQRSVVKQTKRKFNICLLWRSTVRLSCSVFRKTIWCPTDELFYYCY